MFNLFKKKTVMQNNSDSSMKTKVEEPLKQSNFEKDYINFMSHDSSRFNGGNMFKRFLDLTDKVYTSDFIVYNGIKYKSGEIFQIIDVKRKVNIDEKKYTDSQKYILVLKDIENRILELDMAESYKDMDIYDDAYVHNCAFHLLVLAALPRGAEQKLITDFNKIGLITEGNFSIITQHTHEGFFYLDLLKPEYKREISFRVFRDDTFLNTKNVSLKKLYELEVFKALRSSGYPDYSGMAYDWENDIYYDSDARLEEYYRENF